MGNPAFAVPSLDALMTSRHDVLAVVTSPDKPRGRGQSVSPTAIARAAMGYGLPLIQPASLKDESFAHELGRLDADLFAVVAFRMLPASTLELPPMGCVNLHPSLLPQYRGAAPLQWALMNGDSLTGITTFLISPAMDSGDILLSRPLVIFPADDFGALSRRASLAGAELLSDTVDGMASGETQPRPQAVAGVSRAPKITAEDCVIDWSRPALRVRNQIQALSPAPGATTTLHGRRVKIFRCVCMTVAHGTPGEVIALDKTSFTVRCGGGCVVVRELQPEGKRRMAAGEFLAGARMSVGDCLGH